MRIFTNLGPVQMGIGVNNNTFREGDTRTKHHIWLKGDIAR